MFSFHASRHISFQRKPFGAFYFIVENKFVATFQAVFQANKFICLSQLFDDMYNNNSNNNNNNEQCDEGKCMTNAMHISFDMAAATNILCHTVDAKTDTHSSEPQKSTSLCIFLSLMSLMLSQNIE